MSLAKLLKFMGSMMNVYENMAMLPQVLNHLIGEC